ncbi:Proline dehydrogenase 1, mitochondrial [Orchesella cincta]|uniref:Proline dehydrogenase n=1 Tax=Orchesella cincta TaxID=48709 RepID=A0A1D2ML06_ORCCI|nr:Proline dehydrogenase 1, mitochondrial [Orchesella cincta]
MAFFHHVFHQQRRLFQEFVARYPQLWLRRSSSKPSAIPPPPASGTETIERDKLDLSFTDARQAYRSKSTLEILRAWTVLRLCSVNFLVENNPKLMKLGQRILGKFLFRKMMEMSFYGHFVAGPDQIAIQPKLQRLREFGVKAILDYSVEEDLSEEAAKKKEAETESAVPIPAAELPVGINPMKQYHSSEEFADRRKKAVARTYFYLDEAQCERNMETFLQSIEAVSIATAGTGFAAIKLTALGRPQLLMQLSEAIARVHRYVGAVTGRKGYITQQGAKPEDFQRALDRAAKLDPTVQHWLDGMTYDSTGLIHILPWKGLVEAQRNIGEAMKVPDLKTGQLKSIMPKPLSKREEEMFKNMMRRLHKIFNRASDLEVRCYLRNARRYLSADMEQAKRQGFHFGAKLVRGAYMEQERQRAAGMGYPDPINENFEKTTEMYHNCVEEGMRRIVEWKKEGKPRMVQLMAATHNEDTVKFVIQKMRDYGIRRVDRVISFGQLYGMCDQVSFPLGQSGYSAYKYVPYGPVAEVLPYLSRRAQENRGFVGKTKKEMGMLRKEFFRRVLKGQLFYRPKGRYQALKDVAK